MSANRERRNAAADARKAEERKSNLLYGTIAILFVVIAIALVIYNSNFFQRRATALTIGDTAYNAADVDYYYYQGVNQIYQQTYGNPSMIGLDMNTSFKKQVYKEATEDEPEQTWHDFFVEQAIEQLTFVQAACDAAEEAGFTLSETDEYALQKNIQQTKDYAASNGMGYEAYLQNVYGGMMTADAYERNLRNATIANAFTTAHSDELTAGYPESDVDAVYDADPKSYDKVAYKLVTVNGAAASTEDEEGNTVEPTEEETAAAWEEAMKTAQRMLDAYDAGEDLETAAEDFETATYASSEGGSYSSTVYMDWLFEDGRKAGDSTIIEDEENSKIYVVVFEDRFLDETKTVNVRHILITKDSVDLPEDVTPMDEEIKAKAEEIYASWDGTEEGFIKLAMDYSQDGNALSGGIYKNVAKGDMVAEFEDWCFDAARKPGDTGIVKTDYGYHIMYFVGDDQPTWYVAARNTLLNEDLTSWQEELVSGYEAVQNDSGMKYVGR